MSEGCSFIDGKVSNGDESRKLDIRDFNKRRNDSEVILRSKRTIGQMPDHVVELGP